MKIWIQILIFKFRNRIKSTVYLSNRKLKIIFMNSDVKNSDLVQVFTSLKKSEEFLFLRTKKVIHFKKRRNFFNYLSIFCLHQTIKNEKVTGNIIHNSCELVLLCRRTVWVISLSTLPVTLTERENKIKNKLTIFLKMAKKQKRGKPL